MANFLSDEEFNDLVASIDWSIEQLETPRKKRLDAIKQYVTSNYADGGAEEKVPTNFLELAVTIYSRQLAPRVPKCTVSTCIDSLRPASLEMEDAVNQVPEEIGLVHSVRMTIMEAMFSMGVTKVGLHESGVTFEEHDIGEPFADVIDFDDYFVDMNATNYRSIQFEGNDYWLSYDEVVASPLYKTEDLSETDPTVVGMNGEEKSQSISSDDGGKRYKRMVLLRDVWLPETHQLLTYSVQDKTQIRMVDWNGPESGPYIRLGFSDVPGNLLPLPPVALWTDLHTLGNALFRKLARQADSFKSVQAFHGGNDNDVRRFQNARDGDGIYYSGQKPERMTAGGIDQASLAFYLQIRDLYSYFAGNLDSLGGLAPATETVGQDKLLSEAASTRMKQMADMTSMYIKSIFKALAWYEWTNPLKERIVVRRIPDTDIELKTVWSYETREGNFLDYNFDIDIYSTQDDSPSAKMQRIGAIFQNYIVPGIPLIQAQGGSVDFKKLLSLLSRLSDTPEVSDIVTFQTLPIDDEYRKQPMGAPPTRMPATTKRTYERISRPGGGTRSGKDNVMSQILLGGNPQQSQRDSVGAR